MFLVQIASYHYCIVICIVDVHGTAKRWSPYKAIFSPTALRVLLQYIMVAFRKKEYSNNHRQRFPTVLGASYLSREIFSKLRIFEFALCTAARRQRRYQFKDDQILFSPPLKPFFLCSFNNVTNSNFEFEILCAMFVRRGGSGTLPVTTINKSEGG